MDMESIFKGKTVEDAINIGLAELGLTKEDVEIEVLDEGKKKLFGSIPAQVKLTEKRKLTDGERAVAFLEGLFDLLSQDVVVTLAEEEEHIVINLDGQTKGIIGRRGEVIDSVQTLAGAVANTGRKTYQRVVVDCGNYREEREETLKRVAEKMAEKAVRNGKRVRLEAMNPYERRIIHAALADNPDVTTKSEGDEPARYVVITPKNLKPYEKRGGRENRNRGKYNNRNDRDKKPYNKDKYGEKKYPKRELPEEGTPESSGTSFNRESSSGYRKGKFNGFFGTYLGNSRSGESEQDEMKEQTPTEDQSEE